MCPRQTPKNPRIWVERKMHSVPRLVYIYICIYNIYIIDTYVYIYMYIYIYVYIYICIYIYIIMCVCFGTLVYFLLIVFQKYVNQILGVEFKHCSNIFLDLFRWVVAKTFACGPRYILAPTREQKHEASQLTECKQIAADARLEWPN